MATAAAANDSTERSRPPANDRFTSNMSTTAPAAASSDASDDLMAASQAYQKTEEIRANGDSAGVGPSTSAKKTAAAQPTKPLLQSAAASASSGTPMTSGPSGQGDDLPPLPHLFPRKPMTNEQISGDWQLVASSAAVWRARRNVRAKFEPSTSSSSSSSSAGKKDRAAMQAQWTWLEIASFQAKTLVQRIREDAKAKKMAQSDVDSDEQRGERKMSVEGTLWGAQRTGWWVGASQKNVMAGKLERYLLLTQLPSSLGPSCSRSFSYRPQRPTFQRALGKDVQWEIIGYGTALPASAPLRSPQSRPDWFVAYAHPLPLLHPFISVYFRPQVVRQKPGIVTLLLEDILDALRHAIDPWVEEQEDEGEEVAGGSVGQLAGSSTSEEPEGSHAANAAAAGNVANGAPVQSSSTGRSDHHIPTVQDLQRDGGRGRTRNRTVAPTDAYDSHAHSVGYSAGHGPASTPLIPGATATPSGHGGFGHGQVLNRPVRTSNGDESEGGGGGGSGGGAGGAIQRKTSAAGTMNGHAQSSNGGGATAAAASTATAPSISSATSSKATKAEKKREDLKWAVMHLSSEVRPIRGHLSSSRSPR